MNRTLIRLFVTMLAPFAFCVSHAQVAKVRPVEERFKQRYRDYTVTYTHEDDWVVR